MLMAFSLGNVWAAEELKATLDFTDSGWGIPTSGTNTTEKSFTRGDFTIKLYSTTNYKQNSGYLILGKSGSTLTLPAFTWKTTRIEVIGHSGASGSVGQNIFVGNTAVSTATVGANGVTNSYDINANYQAAGNIYVFKVTTAHNTQIDKVLVYGEASVSCSNEVTVTPGSTTHGTFTLSDTKVCADGDGGEITISDITPTDGYAFDEITATVGTVDNENKKVTGITAATTITVLFKELQKYTVSFNTGAGNPSQADIAEATAGAGITLPAGPTPACSADGWTFAGWAAEAVASETTSAPTLLSGKYNPTDNVTLYAVYKRTEGGGGESGSVEITLSTSDFPTSYGTANTFTEYTLEGYKFKIQQIYVTGSGDNKKHQWRASGNSSGTGTIYNTQVYPGKISSIVLTYHSSDTNKNHTLTVGNKENPTDGTSITGTTVDGVETFDCSAANADYFVLANGANAGYTTSIQINYGAASTTYYLSTPSCCTKHSVNIASGIQYGKVEADLAEACEGTEVTLTANPAENYRFKSWSVNGGDVTVTDNKFTMPASDVTVSATFELKDKVTIGVNDANMGSATVNGGAGPIYVDGDVLNLVATPETGYEFVNWTSDNDEHVIFDNASSATTTATVDADVTITANFQVPAYSITSVSANDDKFGTVSLEGLVITATPADGYRFADPAYTITGGTANVAQEGNIFTVSALTADCAITINFELIPSFTASWYINGAKKGEQTAIAGAELVNIPDATLVENGAIAGKVFRGWAESAIDGETDEAGAGIVATPTVMPAADKTYYAVYATEEGDAEPTLSQTLSYDTWTYSGTTTDKSSYRLFGSDSQIESAEFDLTTLAQVNVYAGTFGSLSDKSVKITDGTNTWGTFTMSTKSQDTKNEVTSEVALTGTGKIYVIPNDGDGSGSGARISKVEIYTQKPISYIKYVTNGPKKLANPTFGLAEDTYTEAQSVSITAGEGETIYYTLDGTEPTTESTPYTAAIALDAYGSYTIKAIAAKEDGSKSDVVTATYGINIPFETVTDLFTYIESGKAFLGNISVTGVVSKIVTEYSTEHSNITFNISDTGAESEAQFQSYRGVGEDIAEKVAVGDKVTITGEYTLYGTTHELKQGNVISNRVAAEVSSVVISGEAINTEYFYNDDFSFAGLVATAIYNTGYTKVVTDEANVWAADPAKVTATGNVNVTATYGGKTSDAKVVAVTKQLRTITDEQLAWTAGAATAYTVGKAYTLPTLTNELGLAVTYTSETPETATISNEEGHEGEISIVAAGSTVITASFAGNDEYAAKEVSYTLTVYAPASVVVTGDATKKAYEAGETFSFEGLGAKATYADEAEYEIPAEEIAWTPAEAPVITENTTVEVTATWQGLTSAKKDVAVTVNTHAITIETPENGTLVVKNGEEAIASGDAFAKGTVLTVETKPASANYKAGVVTVTGATLEGNTITVGSTDFTVSAVFAEKAEAGIEWKDTDGDKVYVGYMEVKGDEIDDSDLPELDNPHGLSIVYSSDNTDVAVIDPATGVITPKAEGTTTISATFAGDNDYLSAEVSFDLIVEIIEPEFYLIGSFNDWKFIPVYDWFYQFEDLTPGDYQLKVTTAPNWDNPSQVYGYDALTIKHAGLSKNNDNGNICFTISNEINLVEVQFVKNEEGLSQFIVTGTYAKPTFTVVGVEALVGFNWGDGLNAYENEMAEDPSTGNYELPKEDVMLAAGDYEYQVAMNHDWRNVPNSKLTITESGIYTVTFTFDPSTGTTSAVADLIEPIEVLPTMKIAGDWDVDSENSGKWNENELIVAGDEETATYTAKNLVSGTWYHFWIIKNGVYMSGNKGFDRENLSADLTTYYTGEGSFAMYFQADQDGDYTFTWTYETNVITMTFPYKEATALDNTEAGETAVKVMKNGQLMIMKNGKTYNAQGQIIK